MGQGTTTAQPPQLPQQHLPPQQQLHQDTNQSVIHHTQIANADISFSQLRIKFAETAPRPRNDFNAYQQRDLNDLEQQQIQLFNITSDLLAGKQIMLQNNVPTPV